MASFGYTLGNILDKIGTAYKLPELGLSENLAGGRTQYTGVTPQSKSAGLYYNSYNPSNYQIYGPVPSGNSKFSQSDILGATDSIYKPTTNGQGNGGGGGGGGPLNLTPPQTSYQGPNEADVVNQLRSQYGQAAEGIRSQLPILDQTYELAKGDIQSGIDETQKAADTQKGTLDKQFGDILRSQLQTKQELDRQRMGTFSSLGTLDSSSFGEQQYRGDQAFTEQRTNTEKEKANAVKSVDDQVLTFTKKAQGELARLALQYQQGKNAIAASLAQNDLNSASAISSALDQIRTRAQDVQNNIINFQNQAALLKAQGYDVRTGIGGVTGNDYAKFVNDLNARQLSSGKTMYQVPNSQVQGSGYIGNSSEIDKKKNPLQALLGSIVQA